MKPLSILILLAGIASAQNAENGRKVFVKNGCYQCHGYAGQGTIAGARLAPPVLDAKGIAAYIRRPAGGMPAISEKLVSDQDVADIYAYLKTMPAPKPAKDIPLLNQIAK